ncbi:MAG: hypothetical protein QOH48_2260 [Actinomycetota bacterium]|nr:hypothetical protein [Actinomycetota bacterium]
MDVRGVLEYADGFAQAVVAEEQDLISSYLSRGIEVQIAEVLNALPRPIEEIEVQIVNPLASKRFNPLVSVEFVSVTSFAGPQGRALLRAVWTEGQRHLLVQKVEIVDRAPDGQVGTHS